MGESNFDILTWNVRGLGDYGKRRKIFNWIKKHISKEAIVLLQETHSTEIIEKQWEQLWRGSIKFSHGTSSSRGTLIAFSEGLDFKIKKEDIDNKGRYIILEVEIQKKPYVLINYYAPNLETEQVSVLNDILRKLTNFEMSDDAKIIFGGDFNMILNLKLDADGGNPGLKSNSINVLNKILSENDLIDIWRVRHPEERRFTWRKKTPLLQRRLDYFFLSNILQENIQKVDTLPGIKSDHSPVLVQLRNLYEEKHGPSYWKFNNSLLSDTEYVEAMSSELLTILNEQHDEESDPRKLWEFIKYNVRKFSSQYSWAKSKCMPERRQDLEKRVKFYEDNLLSNSDDGCLQQYHEAKAELDQLYNHITEGIIIRSRTAWYEFGEKSSKYFLGLEKRNKLKTHLKKLLSDDGVTELTDPKQIRTELKTFYSNLYRRRSTKTEQDCLEFLQSINTPRLAESEKQLCEGKLAVKECWEALSAMKINKSPGNDGITKEFYQHF